MRRRRRNVLRSAKLRPFAVTTAKTSAQRQQAFKQSMKAAGYVRLEAYVTLEQREKFRALGGDKWLRKRIDAAKQPEA